MSSIISIIPEHSSLSSEARQIHSTDDECGLINKFSKRSKRAAVGVDHRSVLRYSIVISCIPRIRSTAYVSDCLFSELEIQCLFERFLRVPPYLDW